MVPRKKKYESGEASQYISRKRALKKLQLSLKVELKFKLSYSNPSSLGFSQTLYSQGSVS